MAAITPGVVLHARYHTLRPIGRGGMGAVFEALDLRLHNVVAVKQITAEGVEAAGAFEREAKLLAALRHAAVPVVFDYFAEHGGLFLVMQYIDGEDLEALVRREGPVSLARLQAWASQLLAALQYLHTHQPPIVHRDIKPANLKLTPKGEIVLLDFGLAKGRVESHTTRLDEARSVYGFTRNYAPPEQLEGRRTDARSDIYAAGATLYHLATGEPPASAEARGMAQGIGAADPLLLSASFRALDERLRSVLAQALQLDPAARFQSASDMREALMAFAGDVASPADAAQAPERVEEPRRVDAAIPQRAGVGTLVDLVVQVRFADSPLLGLEDWPSKRLPESIERASEVMHVSYPFGPTGRPLPARLRIKVLAPDFAIEGDVERLIQVPPQEYSKRVAFLLRPRRAGICRVQVEVYQLDQLYLGAVAVDAEAVAVPERNPLLRAASLVLGIVAYERRPQPTQTDDVARGSERTRQEAQEKQFAPAAVAVSAKPEASRHSLTRRAIPLLSVMAIAAVAVTLYQQSPSWTPRVEAPDRPGLQTDPSVVDNRRLPEIAESREVPPLPPTTPRDPEMKPPAAARPPLERPPVEKMPQPAERPRPPVERPAEQAPPTERPGLPVDKSTAPGVPGNAIPNGLTVQSLNRRDIELQVIRVERPASDTLRIHAQMVSRSVTTTVAVQRDATVLTDAQGNQFRVTRDSGGIEAADRYGDTLTPWSPVSLWMEFQTDRAEGPFRLTFAATSLGGRDLQFPPIEVVPPR